MENNALELINQSNSILLLTHESPDGDAIGSILAIYGYLTYINKSVDMVISDIPKIFDFLPFINNVVDKTDKEYDLCIVLDCASKERICQNEDYFSKCKNSLCIDHHVSNTNYCDVSLVMGNISSCSQVIYYLFKEWNIPLSKDILTCLISGVLTDTNGFSINSVDKDTFIMAANIVEFGIDIHNIYNRLLCKKTMSQFKLTKLATDRLEFLDDGKIAFTYILKKDFDDVGAVIGEHEGIVDIGRNIDGVMVSVFLREDDGFTISLRSTGTVDVSKIAKTLGGGGHFMASGCKYNGTLQETKNIIVNEIKKGLLQ